MKTRSFPLREFVALQLFVGLAFVGAFAATRSNDAPVSMVATISGSGDSIVVVDVPRSQPLRVEPLYNDPAVASDAELAAVLQRIVPRFASESLRPNFVEHALRTWGQDAVFRDSAAMSGTEMVHFLTDHGRFLASWGGQTEPLLQERSAGVSIRWDATPGGSVHHDHWLASLTEAGVPLDEPVYTPSGHQRTIDDVLQQSLRDFRLDEREVEWSAMAFGLWVPEMKRWRTATGRELSFDLLARRLMRGDRRFGVCSGTHRVYSLMLLYRLDEEYDMLSDSVQHEVFAHLQGVRDAIVASQLEVGCWPSNWSQGAVAAAEPIDEPMYKRVIATGHHLEWLAIAPRELHPPREQILNAARWIIRTTVDRPDEEIEQQYTFYSHVGSALALWRGTRPADFWREWEQSESRPSETDEVADADIAPPATGEE